MAKTYEFQSKLNTLPMNNLIDASSNFLEWVEPLISKEQFAKIKEELDSFNKQEGQILHKKLKDWSLKNDGSWLASLWEDMYLDIREPMAIDVNYFVKIRTEHLKDKYKSTQIAAFIINKLMDIYESLENENFEPEMIKTTPLCMSAYKKMFKATRIPKKNKDEYIIKEKSPQSYVLIMYKNHMFKLDLHDEKAKRYSYNTIVNSLNNLINSNIETNDTSIGLITTEYRDNAALLLEEILKQKQNQESFEIIKNAVFAVCIDEDSKDLYEFGKTLIGTNESNRYFDKNIQLIFNQKGDFGFNLEHTGADAGSWINVINIINEEFKNIDNYIKEISNEAISYSKLKWIISKDLQSKLHEVQKKHKEKINDISFEIINCEFGNSKIKSLGYSPDAFLHLALQLAQYRTFNKLQSTYEAVATRIYKNGRTECSRPISNELIKFIKAYESKTYSTETLQELMANSCKKHSQRIKDCLGSKGVERYYFALKKMFDKFNNELNLDKLPDFFNNEAYKKLTYSYLSTSRIESKYFNLGGFGPVVPNGFGFWYNLLENEINMNLITKKSINASRSKKFAQEILKALKDLKELASK